MTVVKKLKNLKFTCINPPHYGDQVYVRDFTIAKCVLWSLDDTIHAVASSIIMKFPLLHYFTSTTRLAGSTSWDTYQGLECAYTLHEIIDKPNNRQDIHALRCMSR